MTFFITRKVSIKKNAITGPNTIFFENSPIHVFIAGPFKIPPEVNKLTTKARGTRINKIHKNSTLVKNPNTILAKIIIKAKENKVRTIPEIICPSTPKPKALS